jgi:hypothetical protein
MSKKSCHRNKIINQGGQRGLESTGAVVGTFGILQINEMTSTRIQRLRELEADVFRNLKAKQEMPAR